MTTVRFVFAGIAVAMSLHAQLIAPGQPLPRREKPPVVFLNGYQQNCPSGGMTGTFARSAELLQSTGRASVFFDNCTAGRLTIEELGERLAQFLSALRYEDGQPVDQVDVIAHSMGGLIVRSYLAGKQTVAGNFTPPSDTKIRKLVFLATPQFGTSAAQISIFFGSNIQTQQLTPGSQFVYELATWNQGIDDLRGTEAIAVVGDAGNGFIAGPALSGDGVVPLTAGSQPFLPESNTRVIRACHTDIATICTAGAVAIAKMDDTSHPTFSIVSSFLDGTEAWKTLGQSPEQNSFLSSRAGLLVRWKTSADQPQAIQTGTATPPNAAAVALTANQGIAYVEQIAAQNLQVQLSGGGQTASTLFQPGPGSTRVLTVKPGPVIAAVIPAAGLVSPRTVAAGTFISIYGSDLGTGTNVANTQPYPVKLGDTEVFVNGQVIPLQVTTPGQVNGVLPDGISGLAKVRVRTTQGEHTVNLLLEPSVPAVFVREGVGAALRANTDQVINRGNPIRPGEYVSIYLTGLGATTQRDGLQWADIQPTVTIGGRPCAVSYAGRAPGYAGLDQINCQLATDTASNPEAPLVVTSGKRSSPPVPIPVF